MLFSLWHFIYFKYSVFNINIYEIKTKHFEIPLPNSITHDVKFESIALKIIIGVLIENNSEWNGRLNKIWLADRVVHFPIYRTSLIPILKNINTYIFVQEVLIRMRQIFININDNNFQIDSLWMFKLFFIKLFKRWIVSSSFHDLYLVYFLIYASTSFCAFMFYHSLVVSTE